ncbi:hypothetical protein ACS0TY_018014 [Phlomoides rotata]
MTSLCCPNFGNGFRSYAGRLPKFRHSSNHQARLSLFSFELEIVLGEVLQIRRLGTSPQRNYFQRNSCKLTIKVVQFIFRLQIDGQSCGRDDTEFYRFNKKTFRFRLCFITKSYYNSDC